MQPARWAVRREHRAGTALRGRSLASDLRQAPAPGAAQLILCAGVRSADEESAPPPRPLPPTQAPSSHLLGVVLGQPHLCRSPSLCPRGFHVARPSSPFVRCLRSATGTGGLGRRWGCSFLRPRCHLHLPAKASFPCCPQASHHRSSFGLVLISCVCGFRQFLLEEGQRSPLSTMSVFFLLLSVLAFIVSCVSAVYFR